MTTTPMLIAALVLMTLIAAPASSRAEQVDEADEAAENTASACRDRVDNDDDGHMDCDDQDCWDFVFCASTAGRLAGDEGGSDQAGEAAEPDADETEGGAVDEAASPEEGGHERGRGALVTGVVFASLGTICLATGGLLALAWEDNSATYTASIALFAVGGAQLLAGVILSAVGGTMVRRTREEAEPEARRATRLALLTPTLAPTAGGGLTIGLGGVFR